MLDQTVGRLDTRPMASRSRKRWPLMVTGGYYYGYGADSELGEDPAVFLSNLVDDRFLQVIWQDPPGICLDFKVRAEVRLGSPVGEEFAYVILR